MSFYEAQKKFPNLYYVLIYYTTMFHVRLKMNAPLSSFCCNGKVNPEFSSSRKEWDAKNDAIFSIDARLCVTLHQFQNSECLVLFHSVFCILFVGGGSSRDMSVRYVYRIFEICSGTHNKWLWSHLSSRSLSSPGWRENVSQSRV